MDFISINEDILSTRLENANEKLISSILDNTTKELKKRSVAKLLLDAINTKSNIVDKVACTLPENGVIEFSKIYNTIYTYEVKKGISSVFIALLLDKIKNYSMVIDSKGSECMLSLSLIQKIDLNNRDYKLKLIPIANYQKYLQGLTMLFCDNSDQEYSYFNLASKIQNYIWGLPRYTQVANLSSEASQFRDHIKKYNVGYFDFIFKIIFEIYNHDKCDIKIIQNLNDTKTELDNCFYNLQKRLIESTKKEWGISNKSELSVSINEKYKNRIKSSTDEKIRALKENLKFKDDGQFIENLAYSLIGLKMKDWCNENETKFLKQIKYIYRELIKKNQEYKNFYQLTNFENGKKSSVLQLRKMSYDDNCDMLYNILKSDLEDFKCVGLEKKHQVIIDLLNM